MPSAGDLITRALGTLGIVAASETPTAADQALGLALLNELLDAWSVQRSTIYEIRRTTKTLTASTASYTLGPGGAINVVRPVWIESAGALPVATEDLELPVEVLSLAQWQAFSVKQTTGSYPTHVYYDHAATAGLGTLTVYPVPDNASCGLVLYLPTPLASFSDLTTTVLLPAGYERAIRTNLAVALAPSFDAVVPPLVEQQARESLAAIKRANTRVPVAGFDLRLIGQAGEYDISSDQWL